MKALVTELQQQAEKIRLGTSFTSLIRSFYIAVLLALTSSIMAKLPFCHNTESQSQ